MDAYDAQTTAMMSATEENAQPNNSGGQWPPSNISTQQNLKLERPSASDVPSNNIDAHARAMDNNSRSSFAVTQQQSTAMTIEEEDMQFANYMQNLMDQMDMEEETASNGGVTSSDKEFKRGGRISGPFSKARMPKTFTSHLTPAQLDFFGINPNTGAHQQNQSTPKPPELISDEDRFLQMVSSEVQYKKLLNQSPYALTDIEWRILVQRTLDNLEDGTQKNNGKFKGQSKLRRESMPKEERKTVVVVSCDIV